MNITTKQFQILTDVNLVWDFLTDIYDRETGSGVAAPFFEYALQSSWMDQSYSFLDRLWLDGDRVVAFVFYEAPVTDIFSASGRDTNLWRTSWWTMRFPQCRILTESSGWCSSTARNT